MNSGFRAQEPCHESGGGRSGLPVPNSPYGLCGREAIRNLSPSELRSRVVKVEVDVLGSPSLTVLSVSVDVKQHWTCLRQSSGDMRKSKVAVLGSSSLIVLMVSVDIKQH